jgi:hypothetical protein
MRTATRRLHITHMCPTQRPATHAVTTTAHRAPTALQKPPRPCATLYAAGRSGAIARERAAANLPPPARAERP